MAEPECVVRPARPDDGPAMAEVHVAAWRAAYVGIMPDEYLAGLDVDRFARRWAQLVAENSDDDTTQLVAEVDGQVVGISTAGMPRDDMPNGVGELWQINLHPDSWGHGYGTVLHDAQLQELADMGYDSTYLWVAEGNERARAFYLVRGWREDGGAKVDDSWDPPVRELRYTRPVP